MSDAGDAAGNHPGHDAANSRSYSGLAVVLPHILRAFRREPALALTVAYLLVALAGIYYDYAFYQKGFGIPILSLAQIGDYLVAGLQQPVAIALVAVTFPLCWALDRLNVYYRHRYAVRCDRLRASATLTRWQSLHLRYLEWDLSQTWGLQFAYLVVIFLYGWFFVGLYARHRAAEVKRGGVAKIAVHVTGGPAELRTGSGGPWTYLGAVSNYVFLYDHAGGRSLIVPVNAISRIEPIRAGTAGTGVAPVAARP